MKDEGEKELDEGSITLIEKEKNEKQREGGYASSDSEDEFEFFTGEKRLGTSLDDYVHVYVDKYEGADLDEKDLFQVLEKSESLVPFLKTEKTISTTLNSNSNDSKTVLDRGTDAYFGTELTFTCPEMLAFDPKAMKDLSRAQMIKNVEEEELSTPIQKEAREKQVFLLQLYATCCEATRVEKIDEEIVVKKLSKREQAEQERERRRRMREEVEVQMSKLAAEETLSKTEHETRHKEQLARLLLLSKRTLDAEAKAEEAAANPKNVPHDKLNAQRETLREELKSQRKHREELEKEYMELRGALDGKAMPEALDVDRFLALLAYRAEFDEISQRDPSPDQLAWEKQLALVIAYEELWVEKLPLVLKEQGTVKRKPPDGRAVAPHRVRFAKGVANRWWYDISHDVPCIELSTRRMTWKQSVALHDVMQGFIFDFAKEVLGLEPHSYEGGGHIHIDLSTGFKNKPKLLVNFMTDIHNLGVWPFLQLGFMKKVAPPLSCQSKGARGAYAKVVGLAESDEDITVSDIVGAIQKNVYGGARDDKAVHNQLIGLRSLESRKYGLQRRWAKKAATDDRRKPKTDDYLKVASLEIRAFSPQKSAAEVIAILKLLQLRIRKTKRDGIVKYTRIALPVKEGWIHLPEKGGEGEEPWIQVANAIVAYFEEIPLKIEDYFHFFPDEVKEVINRYASPNVW